MTDFFKSALGGMFGGGQGNTPGMSNPMSNANGTNSQSNDFVGQNIIIGSHKLKISKLLAEGGFAIVYFAVDAASGEEFALKRIFSAEDASNIAIREEINYLKKVVNHPNIIQYYAAACEEKENSRLKEFLILTELCKEPVIDHLRTGLSLPSGRAFDSEQVLQIFHQICCSVQFLHTQEPCIIHRDLKLENFLVSKSNGIKLCDFGSATTEIYRPDNTWSVNKRNVIEDEIAKQTTPMYRAPEMLDLYNNYKIDSKVDIWALGCALYVLCFSKHPFEDAAKLRIINGKYQIPPADKEFTDFHDLIRCLLQINPNDRPDIHQVIFHLENIAQTKSITFQKNLDFLKKTESSTDQNINNQNLNNTPISNGSNHQPSPNSAGVQSQGVNGQGSWMGNATSMFKGNSFMSQIKAASNKVIEGVQAMNKGDLDLTYITSRLIVMSCPTEGIESAAFGNNIDQIKEALESKHGKNYRIYNLANKTYKKEKFSQVIDLGMQLSNVRAPPISLMCKLSANILKFLKENDKNVCIINCNDGKTISGIAVSSLLMYCNLIKNCDVCMNLFCAKRGVITLTSTQHNFLRDTQRLFSGCRHEIDMEFSLSPNECILTSVVLSGVPLFNRLRNGCTPFVEIYNKEKKIFSSIQDYAQMKKYLSKDGQIMIPINCHKFYGDITIMIFHAKSLLGTEKITSTKICQLQFHTAFIAHQIEVSRQISFTKQKLDGLDSLDKYPESFQVVLNMDLKGGQSAMSTDEPWINRDQFCSMIPKVPQSVLFTGEHEMDKFMNIFDSSTKAYSDESSRPVEVEERPSAFYLDANRQYNDSLSSKSSRSASPMPDQYQTLTEQPETNTLLLDFDSATHGESTQETPAPTQQETKSNDIEFLLDLGEPSSTETKTNGANNNMFNNDFFSQAAASSSSKPKNDLDDLFGSINSQTTTSNQQPSQTNMTFDPFESLIKPASATNSTNNLGVFNLSGSNTSMNKPMMSSNNNSSSNLYAQNKPNAMSNSNRATPTDPFADLTAFSNTNSSSQNNLNTQTSKPTTPINPSAKFNTGMPMYSEPNRANYYIPSSKASTTTTNTSSSSHQQKPTTQNNNFNFMTSASTNNAPGGTSAFDDFLPSNFAKTQEKASMSLKDLQHKTNAKDLDPNKVKIMEWTDGKKANIRALLCSLHKVLWENETRWEQCGMNQLVTANDVKKIYRKAVLVVHPDKLTDHPEIELARLIFLELNDAWAQFQNEGQKNLF